MDAFKKNIIKLLQKYFKWIEVSITFGLSLVVGLGVFIAALVGSFMYPEDRILLILITLFGLRFPAIVYLIFYAKKFKPENVQRLITFIFAFMMVYLSPPL